MRAIKRISIPEPCNQPWEQMTAVEGGRHCGSCSKTVVDFKPMTDVEIINYFVVKNNVCGRFNEEQLDRINLQLSMPVAKAKTGRKNWMVTAALLASTIFYKATGQTMAAMPKVEQMSTEDSRAAKKKDVALKAHRKEINGRIFDEACMPLAGAMLRVVGTDITLPTDTNGRFKFRLPEEAKQFTVSYVGFETVTVDIDSLQSGIVDLKLTPQVISMNNVVVVTGYQVQRRADISGGAVTVVAEDATKRRSWLWRMYYKYIRTPIHNIFYGAKPSESL